MLPTHLAIVAFGSNLGDRTATINKAIALIEARIGNVTKRSALYESKALNPPTIKEQPDFINGALCCETTKSPLQVLDHLLEIETELGRVRTPGGRWGPRTIDLDLIAVGNEIINTERLTLPHPEMQNRDFVLVPVRDIAPEFMHPLLKKSVRELLDTLESNSSGYILNRIN